MIKKDYSIKFYKALMTTTNQEEYKFYLASKSIWEAHQFVENYVRNHSSKYHLYDDENDIDDISLTEVSSENYGKSYGYEVIN